MTQEFLYFIININNENIYLIYNTGSCNNFLNTDKIDAVNVILEAFGNTPTCLNSNATRFTQFMSLDFDQTGQIASASIQVNYLPKMV